jgi:CRP-like cAMP-binding protein
VPSLIELLNTAYDGVLIKHYPKGQTILHRNDQALDALMLQRGVIKMYDIDSLANQKILHLFKTPALIPFSFFTGEDKTISWDYAALTDCEVLTIPSKVLLDKMKENDELTSAIRDWYSVEIHEILVRLSSFGKTNTRDKVNVALKLLATRHSEERHNNWWRVKFPVNHQLLADLTGMTRESAAAIMKNLKDEKIIRQPRMSVLEINIIKLTKNSEGDTTSHLFD